MSRQNKCAPVVAACAFPPEVYDYCVVSDLIAGLLAALVATNTPTAVSNLVQEKTGISVQVPDPSDPVEQAFRKLEAEDDDAVAEIEKWSDEAGTATVAGNAGAQ